MIGGYVRKRLLASPRRWLPGVAGIAIALAGFAIALIAPGVAGDVALRSEIRALPVSSSLVTVVDSERAAALDVGVDQFVRGELRSRGFPDVVRQTVLTPLAAPSGTVFRIVGIDDLARFVTVGSGALPGRCDESLCEAVVWRQGLGDDAVTLDPAVAVRVVGSVIRVDERILAGTFAPADHEVVLLVDGAASPARVEALRLIQRSTGWIATLSPSAVTIDGVPRLLRGLASLSDRHDIADLVVIGPDDELRAIVGRARVTSRRLAMPVGQAGTLIGGFAMLTTLAIRPWHRRGLRVLQLRAATARQERAFTVIEASWVVAAGATLGAVLLVIATAGLASAADLGFGPTIGRLGSFGSLAAIVSAMAIYWLLTVMLLRGSPTPAPTRVSAGRWRIKVTDVVGLTALAVWAMAAGRGRVSTTTLASGIDPLLAITPTLAAMVSACVAVRAWPLLMRVARRLTPAGRWQLRLGLASSFGQRGRPLATAAFVASAATLAAFALGYRTTLQAGAADQASFAVPLDFTLREGRGLVRPRDIVSSDDWATHSDIAGVSDVVRRGLGVHVSGTAADTIEVIGLDPLVLSQLHGWRSDFGRRPSAAPLSIAKQVQVGVSVPAGSRELSVVVALPPAALGLAAVFERANGSWHEVEMLPQAGEPNWIAPVEATDTMLHGFRIGESATSTTHVLHNVGEGSGTDVEELPIDIGLGDMSADARPLATPWSDLHGRDVRAEPWPDGRGTTLHTVVHASSTLALFGEAPGPLPAIVDPVTAATARNGVVSLETGGSGPVELQVVGTATRFPTVGARFAVVDAAGLSARLNRVQPGSGSPTEMWLAADDISRDALRAQLAASTFAKVDVFDRRAMQRELAGNTLGRAATLAFLWSAIIAALLAAVAMVFLTHADLLDGLPVLRSLAADGATPRQLTAVLLTRSVAVLVTAAPIGALFGAALLRAVRQLVNISANGTVPVPPLRTVGAPLQVIACLGVLGMLALLGGAVVCRGVRDIRRHDVLAGQP